jgi:hypothetical protein
MCNSSLEKLHEFDEFCKKFSGFPLPHIILGQSKCFTIHIQIQIPLKMNFEQLYYNMHNYTTSYTKLKLTKT